MSLRDVRRSDVLEFWSSELLELGSSEVLKFRAPGLPKFWSSEVPGITRESLIKGVALLEELGDSLKLEDL